MCKDFVKILIPVKKNVPICEEWPAKQPRSNPRPEKNHGPQGIMANQRKQQALGKETIRRYLFQLGTWAQLHLFELVFRKRSAFPAFIFPVESVLAAAFMVDSGFNIDDIGTIRIIFKPIQVDADLDIGRFCD